LRLWDAVSIIIGVVVGSAIFRTPPLVFGSVASPWTALGAWFLGGGLSLAGALCYAEMACAYPHPGGDYHFLGRACGPATGFLFGWSLLTVVLPGTVGAMAFVFADYAARLWGLSGDQTVAWAAGAVVGVTVVNALGVTFGKGTQNALTVAKLLGLAGLVVVGIGWGRVGALAESAPAEAGGFGLAMILVLYAYGGWSHAAYVAAEVRPRRHVALALVLGTAVVTAVYLAVNVAYLLALGFEGSRHSTAVAADVLRLPLGDLGERAMCVLVMVCALGAINGTLFTGARVYAAVGTDHPRLAWLGRWHTRRGAPLGALAAEALLGLAMIVVVGTPRGRAALDGLLRSVGLVPLPWGKYEGGFNTLVAGTAPVFWVFFLLSGLSLLVLRRSDPAAERPFRVPLYPLLPLAFCGSCLFMLYASLRYAGGLTLLGVVPLVPGLLFYRGPIIQTKEAAGERGGVGGG
jgi:amino acid transporter